MHNENAGVVKRGIITPDKHFPLADKRAIRCLTQAIEIVKPGTTLGDIGHIIQSYAEGEVPEFWRFWSPF